ncbi:MAG: DNA N-6-adenine-methyltransferase [Ktedonobacterales bacterium]
MIANERRPMTSGSDALDDTSTSATISVADVEGKHGHAGTIMGVAESPSSTTVLACYAGVPGAVVTECERIYTISKTVRLEALRRIRDLLTPHLQFKQWCADHGENYNSVTSQLVATYGKRPILQNKIAPLLDAPPATGTAKLATLMSSASVEWYTPPDLLDEIRAFLGEIDLDPCPAADHAEHRPDGLALTWVGRVFCNPPYGTGIGDWVRKAVDAGTAGTMTEAVFLIPARTDTDWFVPLWDWALCFIHGRLSFSRPDGTLGSATFPSVLAYYGPRVDAFDTAFAHRGVTLTRHRSGAADQDERRCQP